MKRLFRAKKAVSPVIATVLMILVTMIGMTLLFAFVTSYSDNYKAGIGSSVMESIVVEDISLGANGQNYSNNATIALYNVGKVDSNITSIYVNGTRMTMIDSSGNPILNAYPIKAGDHALVIATWSQNWMRAQTYIFKVNTLKGSNFDTDYLAP